jgi:hypothetical protein
MAETIVNETKEQVAEVKPYTFRKLSSEDMFLMMRICGKIGVKELKNCFGGDTVEMLSSLKDNGEQSLVGIGVSIGFDIVDIVLNNLPKCEKEIYQLLAQVAEGVTEADIKADALLFMDMLVDFVKKEEFPAFIKVVSRLFK